MHFILVCETGKVAVLLEDAGPMNADLLVKNTGSCFAREGSWGQ